MNWADLSSLMIIIVCIAGGLLAPDPKAGVITRILCGIIGFVIGFAVAALSNRCAYFFLLSEKMALGIAMFLYLFVPTFFLFVGAFSAIFVAQAAEWFMDRLF